MTPLIRAAAALLCSPCKRAKLTSFLLHCVGQYLTPAGPSLAFIDQCRSTTTVHCSASFPANGHSWR